jgi:uncharacterized protein YciI
VADYYLVEWARGPAWADGTPRRRQAGWDDHAAFMDGLVSDGFLVLGGPVGDLDGDQALAVVAADTKDAVGSRLAEDPWRNVLSIRSVRPWTIWLRGSQLPVP